MVYFFGPLRTNILVLGIDDSLERGQLGRSDTMILATVDPLVPYIGMLAIPRDLWVDVPGVGEQRINTAYFFAESERTGGGARAAVATVHANFDVPVQYYAVLHMEGLVDVVDALDGVEIRLDRAQGGLSAGTHQLDGKQALAFVRERYSADDFSRMLQAQVLIRAMVKKSLIPANWHRLPGFFAAISGAIETNLPAWQWPRLGFAFLRGAVFGIDGRTVTREMVTPFQTSGGAQVLIPNWEAIQPLLEDMFGV